MNRRNFLARTATGILIAGTPGIVTFSGKVLGSVSPAITEADRIWALNMTRQFYQLRMASTFGKVVAVRDFSAAGPAQIAKKKLVLSELKVQGVLDGARCITAMNESYKTGRQMWGEEVLLTDLDVELDPAAKKAAALGWPELDAIRDHFIAEVGVRS